MIYDFKHHHDNPKDCQLIICATGSKRFIRKKLERMIEEIDADYGKPIQGIILSDGNVTISTPIWESKEY